MNIIKIIKEGLKYKHLCDTLENKRDAILYIECDKINLNEESCIRTEIVNKIVFFYINIYFKNNTIDRIKLSLTYEQEVINKIEYYFDNYSVDNDFKVYLNNKNLDKVELIKEYNRDEYNIYYKNCDSHACITAPVSEKIKNILKNKFEIKNENIYCIYFEDFKYINFKGHTYLPHFFYSNMFYKNNFIDSLTEEQHYKIKDKLKMIQILNNF